MLSVSIVNFLVLFTGSGRERATKLKLIHDDVYGPMLEASWSGDRYVFILVDDFSAMTFSYFMRHKSEVTDTFKQFKAWVEREPDKKIKNLKVDNRNS